MKTTPLLFLTIFLFSALLCEAREAPNPVLDVNGKILRASDKYYVVPLQQDQGGGLDLTSRKSHRCPWSVVQDPAYWWGNTIQFYPVNSKKGVIREWTDLNIEFTDISTGCPESNVWTITGDLSSYDGSHYITTGGEIGNPGEQTLGNWIKIVKTTNAYKLMFCPDVCNYCSYVCRDVGISVEGGHGRLVLSDNRTAPPSFFLSTALPRLRHTAQPQPPPHTAQQQRLPHRPAAATATLSKLRIWQRHLHLGGDISFSSVMAEFVLTTNSFAFRVFEYVGRR
nr:kunitz trypsin inhibitor 2-like [Ipomoea batatas]